ncbi:glycosyltransferase family 61 protein [Bremerella alba]|uniref:Glycosyltransferase 61 catalytic domain-containing protein n=1 Tax=Bremerella alba TaxID=980252 RepID=A0A7V8V2C1_9BACT|nr:glycosyltransferase family 61 protein [Bremerella alba]MBA2113680.1 hypothetical protein [Bremerella alba]
MKSLTRARHELRRQSRTAWNRFVGTQPPTHADHSKSWVEKSHASGSAVVLEPPRDIVNPPRILGGALDEIQRVLDQTSGEKQLTFWNNLYAPAQRKLEGTSLTSLKDARVALRGVSVITDDNCHLLDFGMIRFPGMSDDGVIPQYLHQGYLPRLRKVSGTVGVISFGWSSSNYFHFLIEAIPKLRLFAKSGVQVDNLYAPMSRSYQREMLSLFGVDTNKVIPESHHAHVQGDNVYVPNNQHAVRSEETQFLFETAAGQPWSKVKQEPRKLVYVSRGRMKLRNCLNENEFMPKLEKLGFERHYLETMSVREQVELFQQADVIMGPHGAGLGNMVFAPPGTKVIELGTPYRPYDCFAELSAACGHSFYWYLANPVDGNMVTDESNMWVDADSLIDFLHEHEIVGKTSTAPFRQHKTPVRQIAALVGTV